MKLTVCPSANSLASLLLLASLLACGGGFSSGGSSPPPGGQAALVITTSSILPGTLQNHSYSVTLAAANAQGALQWSITATSATALFVDGLTMDPNTGILSGTANFGGTAGFIATVTDSASHRATKSFTVTAYNPLQPLQAQSFTISQYYDVFVLPINASGGVAPLTFTIAGGNLPPGLRLDSALGLLRGSAITRGTFQSTITIQDSFSPPEVVSGPLTITVLPPPLSVASSLPNQMLLNRPFSGRVVAVGGVPPYHFSQSAGTRPPGLGAVDPNGGQIQGTPTTAGSFNFTIDATDSSPTPQTASWTFYITVSNPIGRNDTVATATPIDNGMTTATISPYIDPPDNAPLAADTDYYRLVSLSGSTVHVETQAQRWWGSLTVDPIDTVIELVDANNTRLTTCRQPGVTANTFVSACINDDIGGNPPTLDSALDFQVPGPANTPTTFYVHVLDWRGQARPDMQYALQISGVVAPLAIQSSPLPGAARGFAYSQQLSAVNGVGALSWSMAGGNLPPGLFLDASGALTGTATTDGTYSFTVQAADSSTPPQTATGQKSITVVEPVKITSPAVWPDACLNQSYTFVIQTSGGLPPFYWSFISGMWPGFFVDQSTGIFSGVAGVTGTFTGTVGVGDGTTHADSQQITVTVKACP
jgi:hypothetical protein